MKKFITYKELALINLEDAIKLVTKIRNNWREKHKEKFKCLFCKKIVKRNRNLKGRGFKFCCDKHKIYYWRKVNPERYKELCHNAYLRKKRKLRKLTKRKNQRSVIR